MRVAVMGFQHESNSFGVGEADLASFVMADSWPRLLRGDEVIRETKGMNLPIAGFIEAAADAGVTLCPVLWCAAEPSAPVTDDAFETITGEILARIQSALPLDALYLDLHGAMISARYDDGEGELLRRLRESLGENIPIAVSLDMHANITDAMIEAADVMTIYRTYPHLDMAATGARCWSLLERRLGGERIFHAFRRLPYLIPLSAQYTNAEPMMSVYALVEALSTQPGHSADLALGFTAADMADTGPSLVCHAPDAAAAEADADRLEAAMLAAEAKFDTVLLSADEAVRRAMALEPPVVIADVQDNPGAGAGSDSTGLLSALVERFAEQSVEGGAKRAVIGLMHDAEVAEAAHAAGVGSVIETALGGKSVPPPFHGRFCVDALGDGRCTYTGAMYGGGVATLGKTAVLRLEGSAIRVVVTTIRNQCLDLAHFTHIGIDPTQEDIIIVKSTAHFRADFEPIAKAVLLAAAPARFPCVMAETPFTRLRHGVRLGPMGPAFAGPAFAAKTSYTKK